jgi:hypothetical protein
MSNTTTPTINDNAPAVAESPTASDLDVFHKARSATLVALGDIAVHPALAVGVLAHVIGEFIAIGEGDVERALANVADVVRVGYRSAMDAIAGVAEKL